jgi:outer membrane protein OmpU
VTGADIATYQGNVVTKAGLYDSALDAALLAIGGTVPATKAALDTARAQAVVAQDAATVKALDDALATATAVTAVKNAATAVALANDVLAAATGSAAEAAIASKWAAANRVRISFSGSGETDSGLAYGGKFDAHNSVAANAGTSGSAFISGAFGKLAMGDLDGADQALVGQVAYVGLTSLGSFNEVTFQSASHNVAYTYSANGLSLGLSTDTVANAAVGGSSYAVGASYTTDMNGTSITVAAGTSSVQTAATGTATQNSASLALGMNGLSTKVVYAKNNRGSLADQTQTAMSMSYTMGQIGVDAFYSNNKIGAASTHAQGLGVSYDMGAGLSAKAGVVRAAGRSYADFGVKMSF